MRSAWVLWCIFWALFWAIVGGVALHGFAAILVLLSLGAILVPVGKGQKKKEVPPSGPTYLP